MNKITKTIEFLYLSSLERPQTLENVLEDKKEA